MALSLHSVVTLDSGLMYRVLVDGDGEQHPLRGTQCSCHYEGRTAQEYSKSPKGKKVHVLEAQDYSKDDHARSPCAALPSPLTPGSNPMMGAV